MMIFVFDLTRVTLHSKSKRKNNFRLFANYLKAMAMKTTQFRSTNMTNSLKFDSRKESMNLKIDDLG